MFKARRRIPSSFIVGRARTEAYTKTSTNTAGRLAVSRPARLLVAAHDQRRELVGTARAERERGRSAVLVLVRRRVVRLRARRRVRRPPAPDRVLRPEPLGQRVPRRVALVLAQRYRPVDGRPRRVRVRGRVDPLRQADGLPRQRRRQLVNVRPGVVGSLSAQGTTGVPEGICNTIINAKQIYVK